MGRALISWTRTRGAADHINLTPSPAARAEYPIYKRDRIIMDEERVRTAIAEAGCEISRVGIGEHLREKQLATGEASSSSKASHSFEAVSNDTCL